MSLWFLVNLDTCWRRDLSRYTKSGARKRVWINKKPAANRIVQLRSKAAPRAPSLIGALAREPSRVYKETVLKRLQGGFYCEHEALSRRHFFSDHLAPGTANVSSGDQQRRSALCSHLRAGHSPEGDNVCCFVLLSSRVQNCASAVWSIESCAGNAGG